MTLARVGIHLAVFGAIMLVARPVQAPGPEKQARSLDNLGLSSPLITRPLAGAYPATVERLARKWSKVFGVPATWIRSQAYAESKNVPTLRNPRTGATGVLQIMPSTAEWLVTGLQHTSFRRHPKVIETLKQSAATDIIESLYNLDFNVMLAAYYLAILKKKFGDDHDIVAAAYNAGPNKIAALLDKGEELPLYSRQYIAQVNDAKRRGFM